MKMDNEFKGILAGADKYFKDALGSGKIYNRRSAEITIPMATVPNFKWNGSEYHMTREEPEPPKKRKQYRSIEEPFEPSMQ